MAYVPVIEKVSRKNLIYGFGIATAAERKFRR